MITLAANLSLMFGEVPFLERFAAAAAAGFRAVEFMFPYDFPADAIAAAARDAEVDVVLFNMPPGDWAGGERGIGGLPDRVAETHAATERALTYALALGCKRLHLLSGLTTGVDPDLSRETLVGNLRHAADLAAGHGIDILIEPINTRFDIPGYFLEHSAQAMEIIAETARPNVKLQYDVYHMQIMEGDLARTIERLLPAIGHIQIADNPGRNEPGTGEIAFPWLLDHIDRLGYAGAIGCEYRPAGETLAGLGWARPYL